MSSQCRQFVWIQISPTKVEPDLGLKSLQNLSAEDTSRRGFQTGELDSKLRCSMVLLDFSLTVKAATLNFTSGCGSTISSAKGGKSGFIYNLVKS